MKLVSSRGRQRGAGLWAAGLWLLVAPATATAQVRAADACTVRDRSEAVVLMVCPRDLSANQWREAADRACGGRQTCNVWIWDEASKAPDKAPATDAELPRSNTAAAVAVWANDSKSLLRIRSVR